MNIATILGYVLIGLGFMGSPQIFVRFMSIKDENEINKGRWVAIIYTLLTDAAAVTIGIMGRYLFTENGVEPELVFGNNGQNVLTILVEKVMPLALVGLYVAVVLAAIMSTIDSLLVVASSAVKVVLPLEPSGRAWVDQTVVADRVSHNIPCATSCVGVEPATHPPKDRKHRVRFQTALGEVSPRKRGRGVGKPIATHEKNPVEAGCSR